MITVHFYKDGVYVKGHDKLDICNLVSNGMWQCIEDCLNIDLDVWHYESCYDNNWTYLGFSYIKINLDCGGHVNTLSNFKETTLRQANKRFTHKIRFVDNSEKLIDWFAALADAKAEQGIIR